LTVHICAFMISSKAKVIRTLWIYELMLLGSLIRLKLYILISLPLLADKLLCKCSILASITTFSLFWTYTWLSRTLWKWRFLVWDNIFIWTWLKQCLPNTSYRWWDQDLSLLLRFSLRPWFWIILFCYCLMIFSITLNLFIHCSSFILPLNWLHAMLVVY
jgi:hypothetical protein